MSQIPEIAVTPYDNTPTDEELSLCNLAEALTDIEDLYDDIVPKKSKLKIKLSPKNTEDGSTTDLEDVEASDGEDDLVLSKHLNPFSLNDLDLEACNIEETVQPQEGKISSNKQKTERKTLEMKSYKPSLLETAKGSLEGYLTDCENFSTASEESSEDEGANISELEGLNFDEYSASIEVTSVPKSSSNTSPTFDRFLLPPSKSKQNLTDCELVDDEEEETPRKCRTRRKKSKSFKKCDGGGCLEKPAKNMKKSLSLPLHSSDLCFESDVEEKCRIPLCKTIAKPVVSKYEDITDTEEVEGLKQPPRTTIMKRKARVVIPDTLGGVQQERQKFRPPTRHPVLSPADPKAVLDFFMGLSNAENETDDESLDGYIEEGEPPVCILPAPIRTLILLHEKESLIPTTQILPLDENRSLLRKPDKLEKAARLTDTECIDDSSSQVHMKSNAMDGSAVRKERKNVTRKERKSGNCLSSASYTDPVTDTEDLSLTVVRRRTTQKYTIKPSISDEHTDTEDIFLGETITFTQPNEPKEGIATDFESFETNDSSSDERIESSEYRSLTPLFMKEMESDVTSSNDFLGGVTISRNGLSVNVGVANRSLKLTPNHTDIEDLNASDDDDGDYTRAETAIPSDFQSPLDKSCVSSVHVENGEKMDLSAPNDVMYLKGGSYRQARTDVEDISEDESREMQNVLSENVYLNLRDGSVCFESGKDWEPPKKSAAPPKEKSPVTQDAEQQDVPESARPNFITYESVLLKTDCNMQSPPTPSPLAQSQTSYTQIDAMLEKMLQEVEQQEDLFSLDLDVLEPDSDSYINSLELVPETDALIEIPIKKPNSVYESFREIKIDSPSPQVASIVNDVSDFADVIFESSLKASSTETLSDDDDYEPIEYNPLISAYQRHDNLKHTPEHPVWLEGTYRNLSIVPEEDEDETMSLISSNYQTTSSNRCSFYDSTFTIGHEESASSLSASSSDEDDTDSDSFPYLKTESMVKAEVKLMVKTTEHGKEAIEIRSVREFLEPNEKLLKDKTRRKAMSEGYKLANTSKPSFTLPHIFVKTPEEESKNFADSLADSRYPGSVGSRTELITSSLERFPLEYDPSTDYITLYKNIPFVPCYQDLNASERLQYSLKPIPSPHTNPFTEITSNPFKNCSGPIPSAYCDWLPQDHSGTTTERFVDINEELLDKPVDRQPLATTHFTLVDDNLVADLETVLNQTNAFIESESQPEPYDDFVAKYNRQQEPTSVLDTKKADDYKNNINEKKKVKKGFFGTIKTFVEKSLESDSDSEKSPKKSKKPKKDKKQKSRPDLPIGPSGKPKLPTPPLEPIDVDTIPFAEASPSDLPPTYKPPIAPIADLDVVPESPPKLPPRPKAKNTVFVEEITKTIQPLVIESEEFSVVVDPTKKETPKKSRETFTLNIDESIDKIEKEILGKSPILPEEKIVKPIVELDLSTRPVRDNIYEDIDAPILAPKPDRLILTAKSVSIETAPPEISEHVSEVGEKHEQETSQKAVLSSPDSKRKSDDAKEKKTGFFGLFKKSKKDSTESPPPQKRLTSSDVVMKQMEDSRNFLVYEVESYHDVRPISTETEENIMRERAPAAEKKKSSEIETGVQVPAVPLYAEVSKHEEKIGHLEPEVNTLKVEDKESAGLFGLPKKSKNEENKTAPDQTLSDSVIKHMEDSKQFLIDEVQHYHDVKHIPVAEIPSAPKIQERKVKRDVESVIDESDPTDKKDATKTSKKKNKDKEISKKAKSEERDGKTETMESKGESTGFLGIFKKSKKEEDPISTDTSIKEKTEVTIRSSMEENADEGHIIKTSIPEVTEIEISKVKTVIPVKEVKEIEPTYVRPDASAKDGSKSTSAKKEKKSPKKVKSEEREIKDDSSELSGFFGLFKKSKKGEEDSNKLILPEAAKEIEDTKQFLGQEIIKYEDERPPVSAEFDDAKKVISLGTETGFSENKKDLTELEETMLSASKVEDVKYEQKKKDKGSPQKAKSEEKDSRTDTSETKDESSGFFGLFKKSKKEELPSSMHILSEATVKDMKESEQFLAQEIDKYHDVRPSDKESENITKHSIISTATISDSVSEPKAIEQAKTEEVKDPSKQDKKDKKGPKKTKSEEREVKSESDERRHDTSGFLGLFKKSKKEASELQPKVSEPQVIETLPENAATADQVLPEEINKLDNAGPLAAFIEEIKVPISIGHVDDGVESKQTKMELDDSKSKKKVKKAKSEEKEIRGEHESTGLFGLFRKPRKDEVKVEFSEDITEDTKTPIVAKSTKEVTGSAYDTPLDESKQIKESSNEAYFELREVEIGQDKLKKDRKPGKKAKSIERELKGDEQQYKGEDDGILSFFRKTKKIEKPLHDPQSLQKTIRDVEDTKLFLFEEVDKYYDAKPLVLMEENPDDATAIISIETPTHFDKTVISKISSNETAAEQVILKGKLEDPLTQKAEIEEAVVETKSHTKISKREISEERETKDNRSDSGRFFGLFKKTKKEEEPVLTKAISDGTTKEMDDTKEFLMQEVDKYHDVKPEKASLENVRSGPESGEAITNNELEGPSQPVGFLARFKKTKKTEVSTKLPTLESQVDKETPECYEILTADSENRNVEGTTIVTEKVLRTSTERVEVIPIDDMTKIKVETQTVTEIKEIPPHLSPVLKDVSDCKEFLGKEVENYHDAMPVIIRAHPQVCGTTEFELSQVTIAVKETKKEKEEPSKLKNEARKSKGEDEEADGFFSFFKKSKKHVETPAQSLLSEIAVKDIEDSKQFLTQEVDKYHDVKISHGEISQGEKPALEIQTKEVGPDKGYIVKAEVSRPEDQDIAELGVTQAHTKEHKADSGGFFGIFKKPRRDEITKSVVISDTVRKEMNDSREFLVAEVDNYHDVRPIQPLEADIVSEKLIVESLGEPVQTNVKDTKEETSGFFGLFKKHKKHEHEENVIESEAETVIKEVSKLDTQPTKKEEFGLFGRFGKGKRNKTPEPTEKHKPNLSETVLKNMTISMEFLETEIKHYQDVKPYKKEPVSVAGIQPEDVESLPKSKGFTEIVVRPRKGEDDSEVAIKINESDLPKQELKLHEATVGSEVPKAEDKKEDKVGFLAKFKRTKRDSSLPPKISKEAVKSMDETSSFLKTELENYEDGIIQFEPVDDIVVVKDQKEKSVTFDDTITEVGPVGESVSTVAELVKVEVRDIGDSAPNDFEIVSKKIESAPLLVDETPLVFSVEEESKATPPKDKVGKDKKRFFTRFGKKSKSQDSGVEVKSGDESSDGSPRKPKEKRRKSSPFKIFEKIKKEHKEKDDSEHLAEDSDDVPDLEPIEGAMDEMLSVEVDGAGKDLSDEMLESLDKKIEEFRSKFSKEGLKDIQDTQDFLFIEVDNYDTGIAEVVTDIDRDLDITGLLDKSAKAVDEVISSATRAVNKKLTDAGETTKDIEMGAGERITEEGRSAKESVEDTTRTKKRSSGFFSKLGNIFSDTKKDTEVQAESFTTKTDDNASKTRNKGVSVLKTVTDKTATATKTITDKIHKSVDEIQDSTTKVAQGTSGDVDELGRQVSKTVDTEKEEGLKSISSFTEGVSAVKEDAMKDIRESTEIAGEELRKLATAAETTMEEARHRAHETADEVVDSAASARRDVDKEITYVQESLEKAAADLGEITKIQGSTVSVQERLTGEATDKSREICSDIEYTVIGSIDAGKAVTSQAAYSLAGDLAKVHEDTQTKASKETIKVPDSAGNAKGNIQQIQDTIKAADVRGTEEVTQVASSASKATSKAMKETIGEIVADRISGISDTIDISFREATDAARDTSVNVDREITLSKDALEEAAAEAGDALYEQTAPPKKVALEGADAMQWDVSFIGAGIAGLTEPLSEKSKNAVDSNTGQSEVAEHAGQISDRIAGSLADFEYIVRAEGNAVKHAGNESIFSASDTAAGYRGFIQTHFDDVKDSGDKYGEGGAHIKKRLDVEFAKTVEATEHAAAVAAKAGEKAAERADVKFDTYKASIGSTIIGASKDIKDMSKQAASASAQAITNVQGITKVKGAHITDTLKESSVPVGESIVEAVLSSGEGIHEEITSSKEAMTKYVGDSLKDLGGFITTAESEVSQACYTAQESEKQKARDATAKVEEKLSDVKQTVVETASKTAEHISRKAADSVREAGEITGLAKDDLSQVGDTFTSKIGKVKHNVKETAAGTVESSVKAAAFLGEASRSKVDDFEDEIMKVATQIKGSANEKAAETKAKATTIVDKAAKDLSDFATCSARQLDDTRKTVEEKAVKLGDSMEEFIAPLGATAQSKAESTKDLTREALAEVERHITEMSHKVHSVKTGAFGEDTADIPTDTTKDSIHSELEFAKAGAKEVVSEIEDEGKKVSEDITRAARKLEGAQPDITVFSKESGKFFGAVQDKIDTDESTAIRGAEAAVQSATALHSSTQSKIEGTTATLDKVEQDINVSNDDAKKVTAKICEEAADPLKTLKAAAREIESKEIGVKPTQQLNIDAGKFLTDIGHTITTEVSEVDDAVFSDIPVTCTAPITSADKNDEIKLRASESEKLREVRGKAEAQAQKQSIDCKIQAEHDRLSAKAAELDEELSKLTDSLRRDIDGEEEDTTIFSSYVTSPKPTRRAVSQRYAKGERPVVREVLSAESDEEEEEGSYTVTEPEDREGEMHKRKPLFHIASEEDEDVVARSKQKQKEEKPERQESCKSNILDEASESRLDSLLTSLETQLSRDLEESISGTVHHEKDKVKEAEVKLESIVKESQADVDQIEKKLRDLDEALDSLEQATEKSEKSEKKLHRVERKFERMASEVMEKDITDAVASEVSPSEVEHKRENEFQRLVSQMSTEEVSDFQREYSHLWDETTLSKSDDWDSKTPDSQVDVQDLPQGEIVYMGPVLLNKDNLINKAGVEVNVIPIMRSPCPSPKPTKKNKRAKSALDFYEGRSSMAREFDRGSLPDLKRGPKGSSCSLINTIMQLNPDRFLYGSTVSLRSSVSSLDDRSRSSELSKGEIMNAVLDWLDKPKNMTDSFSDSISLCSTDSGLSHLSGRPTVVPTICVSKSKTKRRETACHQPLTTDAATKIPQPKPRFATATKTSPDQLQFASPTQPVKLEKQISPVRDDLLDEDEREEEQTYSDKKKFWEEVAKDSSKLISTKEVVAKRSSVSGIPKPKPRGSVPSSQSIDENTVIRKNSKSGSIGTGGQDKEEEEEEETKVMTEYQASFQPPTERKKSKTKTEREDSIDSDSDNMAAGSTENAGYISDSGDVEHYISDSEIEDRVPQIRERQMSVFQQPVAAARKAIYERSASLPTEDMYEVSARSIKLRKQYYEEQIKKEMIEEQLTSEIEDEPSPERKTLIDDKIPMDSSLHDIQDFMEIAHKQDELITPEPVTAIQKGSELQSRTKRSSLGSEQDSSSEKATRDGSTSKPDSMEVHVDKSEIEDSEKLADLDQGDATDLETKSLDSLNATEISPKSSAAEEPIPEITVTLSGKQRRISEESDEYKPKPPELESPINVPEERIEDTVWEVSVQSQPEQRFDEKVTDIATCVEKEDDLSLSTRDESDLGSEIHQDHSESYASDKIKSESHSDIERIILDSLHHQKVDPVEAKAIASALIEEIEAEIQKNENLPPTAPTSTASDYLKYLAETKGLDEREIELVESVLARRSRELARLSRGDTQASSIEITDEDLRYSGTEIESSHLLEQQISQLKAENVANTVLTEEVHTVKDFETHDGTGFTSTKSELHAKAFESSKTESRGKDVIMEEDEMSSESQDAEQTKSKIEAVASEKILRKSENYEGSEVRKSEIELEKITSKQTADSSVKVETQGGEFRRADLHHTRESSELESKLKHEVDATGKTAKSDLVMKGTITSESKITEDQSIKTESSSEIKQLDVGVSVAKDVEVAETHTKVLQSERLAKVVEEKELTKKEGTEETTTKQSKVSSTSVTSVDVTHETSRTSETKVESIDVPEGVLPQITSGSLGDVVVIEKHEEIKRTSSSESKSSVESSGKSPEDQFSTCSSGRKGDSDTSKVQSEVHLRKAPTSAKQDRKSGIDFEAYSSSGESHYHSFEIDSGKSRPCSSDVEGLVPGGSSEYESALTSQDYSCRSHITSTEYQTAVSSLSSKGSMKSLDSESSGHLGSLEVSELSETLVPSASDVEGDILDQPEILDDWQQDDEVPSEKGSKMKRSYEMTFQPEPRILASPAGDDAEKKFGTSLDDGIESVISMSLSSTSSVTGPRTVIERADSERGGSMTISGTSDQMSIEGSCDSLVFHPSTPTTTTSTDIATSTIPIDGNHEGGGILVESITITTSSVDESGIKSVSTQVTSQSHTPVDDTKTLSTTEDISKPHETKKKGHRRQESTSFIPASTFTSKFQSDLTESDKYTAELSFKEVRSDEKKDVDESYETEADQAFHRDVREGKYSDDTPELSSETQASIGELEQEYTSALARAGEATGAATKRKSGDMSFKEQLEKRDSHGKSSSTSSEKSSFEEAEAEAAFNMVAHISPAHKAKQICPILEDEDAEKHELETREKAQKEYEKRRAQVRDQSPGSIPDIKVTQHMTPLVDRNFRYPDLEIEAQEREEKEKEEKEKSTPQTPASNSSKSSEDTDQGREYVLEDSGISIPEEPTTDSRSTVIETVKEETTEKDADSPNSDSFEMLEKPDLIDDFVVIEEVGKEAQEFDTEGKSVIIARKSREKTKKHDEEIEAYLTHSAPTPLTKMTEVKYYPDGSSSEELGFDLEDSPPQPQGGPASTAAYDKELEANKKWIEQQFQGDQAARIAAGYDYEMEFERGPLEDIKEEDINDFDPTSSRIGSLGSQKESGGSLGSVKDSYSSTPEYDVLAGRKYFTRSGEHDDISMSSLQEFENLERVISLENRRAHAGSQDSSSNGSFKTRYIASKSGQGDDVSVSSLKEFEGLEMACIAAHTVEVKAKEEEAMLAQIDEGQESLASESESCETFSRTTDKKQIPDSDEEDYEKRMFEIDEIIRQAQTNVERFVDLKDGDKTESLGRGDSIEEVSKVPDLDLDAPVVRSYVKVQWKEGDDAMVTSTDSIEATMHKIEKDHDSTDSLDQKTGADVMTASTDSIEYQLKRGSVGEINLLSDSIEIKDEKDEACGIVSSDSLELRPETSSGEGHNLNDYMLESTESLDPTSSTATHATYQYDTDSVFSGSFTSGGSNTMVSSTDTIDPVQVDLGAAARKVWFEENLSGAGFATEYFQESGKPYVTEVIEPCEDNTYSHTIHRRVELPPEVRKVTFVGSDAEERLRQFIDDFNEGEEVEETEEVDEAGNIHKRRVVKRRVIMSGDRAMEPHEVEEYLKSLDPHSKQTVVSSTSKINQLTSLTKETTGEEASVVPGAVTEGSTSHKGQVSRRRQLRYEISVEDQTEVDPREHDWRFNLPEHAEHEELAEAGTHHQFRQAADQHQLSDEMKELLQELERETKGKQ